MNIDIGGANAHERRERVETHTTTYLRFRHRATRDNPGGQRGVRRVGEQRDEHRAGSLEWIALPTAVVEHYAVVDGKVLSLARRPLPMQVQADTSYRVRMDVRGNGRPEIY